MVTGDNELEEFVNFFYVSLIMFSKYEAAVVANWHGCDDYVSYTFVLNSLAALLHICFFFSPVYVTLKCE